MPGSAEALSTDSCELLQKAHLQRRQGNVLLIKHPALPWPPSECLERNQPSFDRAVHLDRGTGAERFSGFSCRSSELPFEEGSFRLVVLWHVLADGEEAELPEARRVLAAGGELLILGLQPRWLQAGSPIADLELPGLQRQRLLAKLRAADMEVTSVSAAGLPFNRSWIIRQPGLSALFLPFARLLLVQARHGSGDSLSPARLEGFRAGVARPTEAASLFRQ